MRIYIFFELIKISTLYVLEMVILENYFLIFFNNNNIKYISPYIHYEKKQLYIKPL